jgi:hypothetical protein
MRRECTGPKDGAVKVANTHGCPATVSGMPLPPVSPARTSWRASCLYTCEQAADGFPAVAARHQQHPARLGGGVVHGPPLSGGQIDSVHAAPNPDRPGAATTAGGLAGIVTQLSPGEGERGAAAGSAHTQTSHSRWGYRPDRDRRHAASLQ